MTTTVSPAIQREWPVLRLIERLRAHRADLASRYQIAELGVFGSYVRNEQRPDSDLDVLVSFVQTPRLLTIVALEAELSELLGTRVDLSVGAARSSRIAAHIMNEVVFG